MAISLNLQSSQFGVPFQGAYFRVVTAAISRQRDPERRYTVMVDVVGYATKPENEDTREVDFRRYHAVLSEVEAQSGDGFIAKVYSWVMSQDDMRGAVGT